MTPTNKTQHPLKGVLFFTPAIFLISVVDTICKIFTKDLHSIQLVWGYFVGINLFLWIFFFLKGEDFSKLRVTNRPFIQIIRPAFLVCSISSLFLGLTYLPIAEATAIGFVAPLFITALSFPILKEKVDIHRWSAVVAGLFGILVPVTLKKMNIDPAIASSVFVTTITDVIGFVSFLGVGAYFL